MPRIVEPDHEMIIGSTGTGKSYWGIYKWVKGLQEGRPCFVIDPKGELVALILYFLMMTRLGQDLWRRYRHRILIFDPVAIGGHLLALNALEPLPRFRAAEPDRLSLLTYSLVSHIKTQSGFGIADAKRMENVLAGALGLLIGGGKGQYTLGELPLLFKPTYRGEGKGRRQDPRNPLVEKLLPEVDHYGVRFFWEDQWSQWTPNARAEWIQSAESRVFNYLFDERLLYSLCAVENACLDLNEVVADGYWVLVHIPYGLLSPDISTLIGNFLISRLFYAAWRNQGRRDYRLIIDEAGFFSTGPLAPILNTARYCKLWITLIAQNLGQLRRVMGGVGDTQLLEAAIDNCRYWSVFRNDTDTELLSRMMFGLTGEEAIGIKSNGDWERMPVMAEQSQQERQIMTLPKRHMFFYDKHRGACEPWHTATVVMPPYEPERVAMFTAEHLRLTGRPIESIKAEIAARQRRLRELIQSEGSQGRKLGPARLGGL